MTKFIIRRIKDGDEVAVSRVHIQSWQESYRGLVPDLYLDQLNSKLNERIENWRKAIANPQRWIWVAEIQNAIVGFVILGPPRDTDREGYIELGAIYLLADYKRMGIGYSLLKEGFVKMKELGYSKAYCWVLENNPTIRFYEKTGAKASMLVKQDEIGGKNLNEIAYEWKDLSHF